MQTLLTIAKLLPAIITMIKAIEDAIPASGQGAAKLEMITQILQIAEGNLSGDVVSKVVSIIVTTFKKVGIFS